MASSMRALRTGAGWNSDVSTQVGSWLSRSRERRPLLRATSLLIAPSSAAARMTLTRSRAEKRDSSNKRRSGVAYQYRETFKGFSTPANQKQRLSHFHGDTASKASGAWRNAALHSSDRILCL